MREEEWHGMDVYDQILSSVAVLLADLVLESISIYSSDLGIYGEAIDEWNSFITQLATENHLFNWETREETKWLPRIIYAIEKPDK